MYLLSLRSALLSTTIPTHCKFKVQLQMRKIDFDRVDELLFAGCVIKSENKKRELSENG